MGYILLQILIRLLQIFVICVLAVLVLRPWVKLGILNPRKKRLNIFDRLYLFVYQTILTIIILEGVILIIPLTLIVSIFIPNRRKFFHAKGRFWTNLFLKAVCVKVNIEGAENIPAGPVIFVQNIQNYLDGAATLAKLPASYHMIFQRHLMEVPLLGWLEKLLGYLALEQEEISLMHEDVLEILKVLSRGESVLAFAEEKTGGFEIHGGTALFTLQSKLPIIPVAVKRNLTAPQVGAFLAKPFPYEINLKIGKPIQLAEMVDDKVHRQKIREQIANSLLT